MEAKTQPRPESDRETERKQISNRAPKLLQKPSFLSIKEAQREEDRKVKRGEVEEAVNGNEETTPEEKSADIENQMKEWEAE